MKYDVKDLNLAKKGKLRIEWANEYMSVLSLVRKHFKKEKPLKEWEAKRKEWEKRLCRRL